MNSIDYKLDAILRCLYFYYSEFVYSNEIYRASGDESYKKMEFVPVGIISAWLAFSETGKVNLNITELEDLLRHLEDDKLVSSKLENQEKTFKINPLGIDLLENNGYVRKNRRANTEYKMKRNALTISIIALLISAATFVYTVFLKKQ